MVNLNIQYFPKRGVIGTEKVLVFLWVNYFVAVSDKSLCAAVSLTRRVEITQPLISDDDRSRAGRMQHH